MRFRSLQETNDKWYIEKFKNVYEKPKENRDWKIVVGLLYVYRPDPTLAAIKP